MVSVIEATRTTTTTMKTMMTAATQQLNGTRIGRRDSNWDNDDNDVRNKDGGGDKGGSVYGR